MVKPRMEYPSSLLASLTLLVVILISLLTSPVSSATEEETPQVIFLRRQVRQYGDRERASITIVFYSRYLGEGGLTTRWFRPAPNQNLPYAELANKLPTAGDDRYVVNTISAGNVVASSVVIKRVRVRAFPHEYSLIVKVGDHPMQYLVTTRITREITTKVDILDGIHWIRTPPPTISFGYNGQFTVTCRAEIDSESQSPSLDELHMYRTYIEREGRNDRWGRLVSVNCGAIHRARDNYVEESGKYKQVGRRFVKRKLGIAVFELVFSVRNATREDQGMYSCAMERLEDTAFVSTWVTQDRLETKPLAEFIPCEAHSFNKERTSLIAESRKETCFRCRGFGYPQPEVAILKKGIPLEVSDKILMDRHVNVADGGLAEVTYTFLDPTYEDNGNYACAVKNQMGEALFPFNFLVV